MVAAVELEIRLGKLEVGCLPQTPGRSRKREQWRLPRGESWHDCEMPHLCPSHYWPISVGRALCTPGGGIVCEQGWDRTMALSLLCFVTWAGHRTSLCKVVRHP